MRKKSNLQQLNENVTKFLEIAEEDMTTRLDLTNEEFVLFETLVPKINNFKNDLGELIGLLDNQSPHEEETKKKIKNLLTELKDFDLMEKIIIQEDKVDFGNAATTEAFSSFLKQLEITSKQGSEEFKLLKDTTLIQDIMEMFSQLFKKIYDCLTHSPKKDLSHVEKVTKQRQEAQDQEIKK